MATLQSRRFKWKQISLTESFWEYVFGEEKAPEGDITKVKKKLAYQMKQRQTKIRIIKWVMTSQLPHMMDPDPKIVWAELVCVHHAGGFGSKLAMLRFLNVRMLLDFYKGPWVQQA